jgi:hypothetical protein
MQQPNTNSLPEIRPPSDDPAVSEIPPLNKDTIYLPEILPPRDDTTLPEIWPPGEDKIRDDDDSAGGTTETSEDEDSEVEMDRWRPHSEQASYYERLPQPVVPIIALTHPVIQTQFPSTVPTPATRAELQQPPPATPPAASFQQLLC